MRLRGHLCGAFFPFLMRSMTSLVRCFSEHGPFVSGADTGRGVVVAAVRAIMAFKPVRKLTRKH
jgi:hypothetical protein